MRTVYHLFLYGSKVKTSFTFTDLLYFCPLLVMLSHSSHKRQDIPTTFNLGSVSELIEILLDNYEASLTADERREVKTLLEVY